MLTAFGGRVKDLEAFLLEERLPEGWESCNRDGKGLTIISFNKTVSKVERGIDESEFATPAAFSAEESAIPNPGQKPTSERIRYEPYMRRLFDAAWDHLKGTRALPSALPTPFTAWNFRRHPKTYRSKSGTKISNEYLIPITVSPLHLEASFQALIPCQQPRMHHAGELGIQLRRSTNRLASICLLPSELLSRIFELGRESQLDDWEIEDTPICERKPFEILVTHVSSHFREVATGTPQLWSDITINSRLSRTEMETYLARASGCELALRLEVEPSFSMNPLVMANVDTIIPHSNRCRQLVINSISETLAQEIIERFSNISMPFLRHLSIAIDDYGSSLYSDVVTYVGSEAKCLSFVRLRGIALLRVSTSFKNITTLHLDQTALTPILYSTFHEMVTSSPALQHLSVYGDIILPTPTGWLGLNDPINIPKLHGLRICAVSGNMYSGLLLGISAPSLASIVLKDVRQRDLQPFLSHPFSSTKFPLLHELVLIEPDITIDESIKLVRALPTITSFAIYRAETPEILELLADPVADYVPWPSLQTLAIILDENDGYIVDIVEQRLNIGHPLQRMRLGTSESLSLLPDFEWLQDNIILESFVSFGRWPASGPRDPEDTLFSY
ncbi:hypothetical protein H0H92_014948 [Tricholoma furcatifolium]|nr:hypothetical protein H0H92_014948 [Tricholoma furcatifolium]